MNSCVGCLLSAIWVPIMLAALSFGFVVAPIPMAILLVALALLILFRK